VTALKSDYRRLVGELAAAARLRNADLIDADTSYVDGMSALSASASEAAVAVERAQQRLAAAQATVAETDSEATLLWTELRGQLGWRGRRLGEVPDPSTVDHSGSAAPLVAAADRIARGRRTGPAVPLSRGSLVLLPVIGAVTAALVALVSSGLASLGVSAATVLGQLGFLVASFSGLPVAVAWARRRHSAGLDAGGVGLTVLGGMVACAFVILLP
jgi:hypothetical protein